MGCISYRVKLFCVQGVASRDIKLENTLLDGSPRPLLKICDFGYSKVRAASQSTSNIMQSTCKIAHPPIFLTLNMQIFALDPCLDI